MTAMQDAALHNHTNRAIFGVVREDNWRRSLTMGFYTELFVRPRPEEVARLRTALATLESMSPSDRSDIGIRPADFPRIAREMPRRMN